MEERRFERTYDGTVTIITNLIILITLGVMALNIFSSSTAGLSAVFILIPLTIFAWLIHPVYYAINNAAVIIKRPFGVIEIDLDTIIDVRPLDPSELAVSVRIFGSGGLFGYLGTFHSSSIGRYSMWSTNRNNLVLIECQNKKIVISPSDPEGFCVDFLSRRNRHH